MPSESTSHNRTTISLADIASERSVVLRLAWRDSYFGYFYYAYAPTSGRCFAPGRFCQK
jgi:hypothetical protein